MELLAPNGQPSNLIGIKAEDENGKWVYLYDLVRSNKFKEFFGDWEEAYITKDYDYVSKIIDENGEPNICYHSTSNEFFEFDENYIGSKTDSGYYGKGFYFTEGVANSHYGEREIPCFLNIRNPLSYKSINRTNVLNTNELKDKGYDGVLVFDNWVDVENIDLTLGLGYHGNNIQEIVAYYPEQIKLADATNTTFDRYDSDIRYAGGGKVKKVKFDIEEDEDRIEISLKNKGKVVLAITYPRYEFSEDIGEDGLIKLGIDEDDVIGKIEHIEIEDEYKGKGYAKILMNKAIEIAKERGLMPLYLNASPMGFKGLRLNDLTSFYESFGFEIFLSQGNNNLMILKDEYKTGGKVRLSKTPAPKSERIYGSKVNKPKSSASKSKASSIILNPTVIKSINTILKEHNEDFPKKKVPLSTAKAVVRRGMGAFSSSYRPTISGGKPNSRVAWGLARLKAFVYKIQKGHSKSGKYKQDNDLIEELGYKYDEYKTGGELENDKTFILTTYFVSAETDTDSSNIYKGTDYERAKLEFDSANITDFDGGNGGMVLFQKVIDKYKFIGDLEDGYYEISDFPIEDYYNDKDYYKIIENGEFEHIDSKDVAHVNNESDDLLHDVESYYQKTYGNWKYNKIIVDNGKDENDDDYKEYGCIQLRITNHSENVINNDKFGSCDYYISVVIANKNPTKDKFLTSMYERRRNEIELRFNSDNSFDEIINEIDSEIANGKLYIAEKLDISVNDIYINGGELVVESLEKRVKNRLTDNIISSKDLAEIFGREPNYPNEYVGDLKLQKCFLLPYYKLIK